MLDYYCIHFNVKEYENDENESYRILSLENVIVK
jgi:hypothetical protein